MKLVNPTFLAMIDDMFYMLPFNDRARMERLQKKALVAQEMATLLAKVDEDLHQRDTIKQLWDCWLRYLEVDSVRAAATAGAVVHRGLESRFGRRTLPQEEQPHPSQAEGAAGCSGEDRGGRDSDTTAGAHSGSGSDRFFHPPPFTLSDP